jgi:hypothetical protein
MAADILQHAGYKTIYLGADVPVEALATAVMKHDAGLLCLSITMKLRAATLERTVDVLAHNHPCVDPEPSDADIAATRRVADAAAVESRIECFS